MKNLIIVESPTKAKTISRFLGKDFAVESSYGHIRDLPTYTTGVDTQNNFEPKYVVSRKHQKNVKNLKEKAAKAERIILATDEDREGEAIAWHLAYVLGFGEEKNKKKTKKQEAESKKPKATVARIVFHEITKKAIEEALSHPRDIDMKLVNAQQARRVLDRLVGYELSPFLWKKVSRGLSAGRVQSIAVRLIVEREREIKEFKPEEYWSIDALLKTGTKEEFPTRLIREGETTLDKFAVKTKTEADAVTKNLQGAAWRVESVEKRAVTKNPPTPFTTSTLQQEASRRMGFSAKQTMLIAQQLYEGVELGEGPIGLITYMRTDSMNMAEESLAGAREFLTASFGETYALSSPRRFKTKTKGAQEAHEAIRPTDPARTPDSIKQFLNRNQFRLYELVWRRFIATQMPEAIFDATTADIAATSYQLPATSYTFRATGHVMKFDGFLKVYPMKTEDIILPELKPKEELSLVELKPEQHFTEPPPRFSEASIIKILEKYGIGRPSTYAPTIATIQDRGYVQKNEQKRFVPTEIGFVVNDLLVEHFPQVVDIQFTAKMEEEFDEVAEGKQEWQKIIGEFYGPFHKNLEEKMEEVKKQTPEETTEAVCEKCGKPMIVKYGRFGKFLACSGFPECKSTKSFVSPQQSLNMKCPICNEGDVIIRHTKRRKIFYGCSRWPDCTFAAWSKPTGEKCPKCGNPLIELKNGVKCNSKECDYKNITPTPITE
ncbi:MAG: type I DNA topoisomerase [bacterium]|nr:type I DNA topoisomerase [bacterium]